MYDCFETIIRERWQSTPSMSKGLLDTLGSYTKLAILFGILSGILVGMGFLIGGMDYAWMFLALSLGMNMLFYFFSDRLVLAASRAKMVSKEEAPELHQMVEGIAQQAGIPTPRVGIVDSKQPNAFATGRNPQNAVVVVTTGLTQLMDRSELESVLAHEVSHVLNRDTLVMTIAVSIATAISYIGNMIVYSLFWGGAGGDRDRRGSSLAMMGAAIVAPLAATLVQLAISRSREYGADESAARLTKKPMSLASALTKIEAYARGGARLNAQPTTSSLWIVNPFSGAGLIELFSTHPSTRNRVRRLEEISTSIP